MKFILSLCVAILCSGSWALADDTHQKVTRLELEFGKTLHLKNYGGSDIEMTVRDRDMGNITVYTLDYTKPIRIPTTINGYIWTKTGYANKLYQVPKNNGVHLPGFNHDLYLLLQDPKTGVKVYFLNEISPMNRDSLVITAPKSPVTP